MDLKQLTLRQCIKSTWNILVSYYVLNCYKYWLTLLDKLKTVVNGNVFNYSGEVEMIFLLTQYFIHRVAKSSLGVDITPIKNGTCMSWKKLKKTIRNKQLSFALDIFFLSWEMCLNHYWYLDNWYGISAIKRRNERWLYIHIVPKEQRMRTL